MDLKNINLKNLKLEDIKARLLVVPDKKTLIKFGIGFGSIIVFLISYYAIVNPVVNEKKAQIDIMMNKTDEINQFSADINAYKKTIETLKPEYEKSSTLFHSKEEVEGLYQSLSQYSGINGLVISKIEKKKPKPVLIAGVSEATPDKLNRKNIAYYKIPVDYEIKGNFLGYVKFKRSLSKSGKMLNFEKESINIVQNDTTGAIIAKGVLTIVGLTDDFF